MIRKHYREYSLRKTKLFLNDFFPFFQNHQTRNKIGKNRRKTEETVVEVQQPTAKDYSVQHRGVEIHNATQETKEVRQMNENLCNVKKLTRKLDEITAVEI